MRPTTPKQLSMAQQAQAKAQSQSPPQTPTTPPFRMNGSSRRSGMLFKDKSSLSATITPLGNGPSFSYTPFNKLNPADFSPRSSSPASSRRASSSQTSEDEDEDEDENEDEDEDEDEEPPASSPMRGTDPHIPFSPNTNIGAGRATKTKTKIIAAAMATFEVEDFAAEDYLAYSDSDSVIYPTAYSDASSTRAPSVKSIDARLLTKLQSLNCASDVDPDDREAWVEAMRAEKRRKRRSSSSVQKRTISMSIGSDTDEEDLEKPMLEDANEAGSSARRLRRKMAGERGSLIFDDPPLRVVEEEDEEVIEGEEMDHGDGLPYWDFVLDEEGMMEVDSDEE